MYFIYSANELRTCGPIFFLFHSYDYYSVSRTLCPLEVEHRIKPQQVASFLIDISSASKINRSYTLSATLVKDFDLQ